MKFLRSAIILLYAFGSFLLLPIPSSAGQIDELTSKAQQGQAEAQFKMGEAFYAGKLVSRDLKQALFWYEKAAQQGHPKAQRALGALYELGKGTAFEIRR